MDLAANGNLVIPRQDEDLSSTEKYMLGTVYLWTLETTAQKVEKI